MRKKRPWDVFFIEAERDRLASRKARIFSYTREGAGKKIEGSNRLVTAIKLVTPTKQKIVTMRVVICKVFNGSRCTICGGFFGEDDDICTSGHQLGQKYNKRGN